MDVVTFIILWVLVRGLQSDRNNVAAKVKILPPLIVERDQGEASSVSSEIAPQWAINSNGTRMAPAKEFS